ncbi:alpha/beta fold hydrolase [Salinibaculum rarum]|uniref:alpha/beta fold hydrolase n=1 Tax=Salinibaculum rarum TaxID=3058903 RepID=UPI00265DB342|nr:alpha/beta hydrolase [Salinibaculum sp. KK48]
MPYADNDGVQLAYERDGVEDGETIAFVCGLGYGTWMWNWQRERLADEFDLLLWDNRGAGDSDVPEGPYTISEMAADLEAVLEAAGVASAHVVGASMGGMIAQQYALEYDRAETLSLLCTTPGGPEEVPIPEATLERMFGVPDGYDSRETIRYKMQPALTDEFWAEHEDVIEQIVDWRLDSDASEQARAWQGAAVEAFDVSQRLDEITVPTLVLHGERDRVVPVGNSDLLVEGIPTATRTTFDEGGAHLFFIERADAVTDSIRQFLR